LTGPYGARAERLLTVRVEPVPRPARGTGWNGIWKEDAKAVTAG
jgi:hypothetical protein